MGKQSISEVLQMLLRVNGDLNPTDLAKETGVPQPTIHHILEGKTKKPRQTTLKSLADFFSISISQLTGVIPLSLNIPSTIKDSLRISTVPLINWELAKAWERNKNDLSKYKEILIEKQVDENAFALQLLDSKMEPLFQESSILIFDPSKKATERDFVLVYLSKSDSIIFNRLFIDGKNYYIKKDKKNGDAELIKLDFPDDKCIATLIESRLSF
jgi:transcriptional regulator with XRE-family HTH domain